METDKTGGWDGVAEQWIAGQGDSGDQSRRMILDPCLDPILLPHIDGKKVLDVGCGEGRYCRKLAASGAIVTGIDPVERFIDRARSLDPESSYILGGGESLPFESGEFNAVLTYLTLVDILDYKTAIAEMCRVLAPGGRLFMVTVSNMASTTGTWVKDENGNRLYRKVDRYMEEFSIEVPMGGYNIINHHRPLSAVLSSFFAEGLVMDGFFEPLPPPDSDWYREEHRVPTFQVIRFQKTRCLAPPM
jgi:SAM-dependent methyltransferase